MANAIRIKTSTGWQDIAVGGPPGPPGAVGVYEQASAPVGAGNGDIWIDTDETLSVVEAVPDATGQDGKWLRAAGGAAVWNALVAADVPGLVTADTAWRFVGTSGQPPFENGYSSWDGAAGAGRAPRFRKLASGLVLLDGILKLPNPATPGLTAFTVPVGYRTAAATLDQTYWVNAQQFPMVLSVSANGAISVGNGPTALPNGGWVYIDNARYYAEQ